MNAPSKDRQTVTSAGEPITPLPHGVHFHDVQTHGDARGEVFEIFDLRWGLLSEPCTFAYAFTIRPGMIKGWSLHEKTEDRYFVMFGEMELVLYDERPQSPTLGLVARVVLSSYRRRIMNIPPGIWHADRNLGSSDVIAVNFKTVPFDHTDPDKLRLPLDNDRIPFKFDMSRGW